MSSDFLSDLDKWVVESIEKKAEEAATSHPSQSVDDGNKPATEGARSSENEADVKADIPGDNVDVAKGTDAEGAGRGENAPVMEMANAKPTGEDPANETASVKDKPEEPGTAHPAKATMGEKYSSALMTMGDEILNDITAGVEAGSIKQAEAEKSAAEIEIEVEDEGKEDDKSEESEEKEEKEEESEEKEASADELKKAEDAGRAAAASIIDAVQAKEASAEVVDQSAVIESIVKNASADAANVIEYLGMFQKASMEGMAPEEAAMLAEAAASEAPATDVPAEAAGLEAAGPEMAPEMGGAGMGGDAEVEALVDALVEAGVEPEELLALAGGGEGAPVEEAAVAPEAGAEDVVEEAAVEDIPKEAADKKAAIRQALETVAKKTA